MSNRLAAALIVAVSVLSACDSGSPTGPGTSPTPSPEAVRGIEDLLSDPYSVEALSLMLLKPEAEAMRVEAIALSGDLSRGDFTAFEAHLTRLDAEYSAYLNDPEFDPRDLPVAAAIGLLLDELRLLLDGFDWLFVSLP